ncbi:MAG: phage head closure protein [Prevotella sp.]|nr:phage head closure protein [Prevotella sp.]
MNYSTGLLKDRITIQNRTESKQSKWGMDGSGVTWQEACTLWANIEWAKGKSALNAGAIDAYAVVLVRMRWTDKISMRSRIVYDEKTYQIIPETFHADCMANTIQFNAQVLINDK